MGYYKAKCLSKVQTDFNRTKENVSNWVDFYANVLLWMLGRPQSHCKSAALWLPSFEVWCSCSLRRPAKIPDSRCWIREVKKLDKVTIHLQKKRKRIIINNWRFHLLGNMNSVCHHKFMRMQLWSIQLFNEYILHLDAIRTAKDSVHFCASSGCGRVDSDASVLLRRRNPRWIRILKSALIINFE